MNRSRGAYMGKTVTPKPRQDDTGALTDHDRIIRLEADHANLCDNVDKMGERFTASLDKFDAKVEDLPSEKAIALLIKTEVHKALAKAGTAPTRAAKIQPIAYGGGGGALALLIQQIIERILTAHGG